MIAQSLFHTTLTPMLSSRSHPEGAYRAKYLLRSVSLQKKQPFEERVWCHSWLLCCWSFVVPVEGAEMLLKQKEALAACTGLWNCVVFVARYLSVRSQTEELSVIDSFSYNWMDMKWILSVRKKYPRYWKTRCWKPYLNLNQGEKAET